ncbi:TPA: restriction endonuclease subunit S [Enterococcus faecalis]|uniref:restriction endonuclease subunit S n=2 Tax=Enterococcus faecalis TaxID=1351 RepID=UPI0015726FFF|nr:restriction endonuclease subunit S [Enterococcus faecalis]NSV32806.1 restriction endonuclease subunit S [Enterococcus faecalis]HAP4880946.1 restriction endonuclease subunit S [Enterococcus faecalis]HBI1836629.1 restriction endonuclease subunit S [Enterococcus faecalis]
MRDEMKKVPRLRFRGFSEDWELCKFKGLLDEQDGIRRGPFGSALKKAFFVENSEYVVYEQQNAIYDTYETRYKISKEKFKELEKFSISEGDFIMSGAGTIGRISRVPKGVAKGVFNQALIRFRTNTEVTDSEYFIQFVRADKMQKKLTGANPGSAITNLVPMSEIKKWDILIPSKKEQILVGLFLKKLDNTITLHQRKLDQLKELKKAYLKAMFVSMNTKNNKVPKLRFTDFEGDWEQRKLGNISKMYQPQTITGTELLPSGYPVFGANGYIGFYSEMNHENDQVTISARGEGTGTINYVNGPVWITGNSMVINVNDFDINKRFLHANLSSNSLKKYITGGAQPQLTRDILTSVPIKLPNIFEQNKIGLFFKQLDETVNLHQNKLTQLKSLKKAYLQNMFI